MFDSSTHADHEPPAHGARSPTAANDMTAQHEMLARRLVQVFARCGAEPASVTALGHCVSIRRGDATFSATISGDHLLLLKNSDRQSLGRFSTPAGLCRRIATLSSS